MSCRSSTNPTRSRRRSARSGAGATCRAGCPRRCAPKPPTSRATSVRRACAWMSSRRSAGASTGAARSSPPTRRCRYTPYTLDDVAAGADDSPIAHRPIVSLDAGLVLRARGGLAPPAAAHARAAAAVPVRAVPRPGRPAGVRHGRCPTSISCSCSAPTATSARTAWATRTSSAVGRHHAAARRGAADGSISARRSGQAYYFEDPRVRLPDEPASARDRLGRRGASSRCRRSRTGTRVLATSGTRTKSQTDKSEVGPAVPPAPRSRRERGLPAAARPASSSSTCPWPGRSATAGAGSRAGSTRMREDKTLDQFVGLEYCSCCWALRLVTRRFVSSRTGDTDTSFGLQLELKGLSSVGVDNEAFLRERDSWILRASPPSPSPEMSLIFKAIVCRRARCCAVVGPPCPPRSSPAPAVLLDRIAAVVNDGIVLRSELEQQIQVISGAHPAAGAAAAGPQRAAPAGARAAGAAGAADPARRPARDQGHRRDAEHRAHRRRRSATTSSSATCPPRSKQQGVDYRDYRDEMRREMTMTALRQRDVDCARSTSRRAKSSSASPSARARRPRPTRNSTWRTSWSRSRSRRAPSSIAERTARAQGVYERARSRTRISRSSPSPTPMPGTALEGGALGWRKAGQLPSFVGRSHPGDAARAR